MDQRHANHSDGKLLARVWHELEQFGAKGMRPTVSGGAVTLEGEVASWTERDLAGLAVRALDGVRSVENRIVVHAPPRIVQQVRRAIEGALDRHAQREARHIDLAVHDGVVKLSGHVGSWSEKQVVLGSARGIDGVKSVEDELTIEP